jgi:hypothetical protein
MLRFDDAAMRSSLIVILILLLSLPSVGQKSSQTDFEVGPTGGVSWYNGDLNPRRYFDRQYMHEAYGLSVRRNINQRFAFRGQFMMGTLSADDALATDPFQVTRNLNFSTPIYEVSGVIEFNFLTFDALITKYRFSPYSFFGLGGFYFNPTTQIEGNIYELQPLATEGKSYSRFNVSIPFGMGVKLALTDRLIVSADWGMRKTFSDYIDDVSGTYPLAGEIDGLAEDISDRSLKQSGPDGTNWGTQRGDQVYKDWYSFVGLTFAVRLGPKKGSCKHLRI